MKLNNKILKSDLTLKFADVNFKPIDFKLLQYVKLNFLNFKNKNFNTFFNDTTKFKNSKMKINSSFNIHDKSFKILKINTSGNVLKKISNFNYNDKINLNTTLSGFFKFNYENKKFKLDLNGNLKKNNFKFKSSQVPINFNDIDF